MTSTLMRIVLQNVVESTFIDQLTNWEFDISEFERVTCKSLPESLLIAKTSGAVHCYVRM